ncbi:MAG: C-GCAxxG-C-C family protein [Lachnospirales bacterium]
MELSEKQIYGLSIFDEGYNCAQATFSPFATMLDIDKETALKVTGAMGGGVTCGNVCGAILGVTCAIGSKYGQIKAFDKDTKQNCVLVERDFIQAFKDKHTYVNCEDLLGYNVNDQPKEGLSPEELREIYAKRREQCKNYVADAISIGEELLKNK